ncbi:MAG: metal-dependent transcriptional regulator [Kiritimatiellae bacterium]|nr:metal-dependent transcriptional regulator [Kiritimatiellia bacterium]
MAKKKDAELSESLEDYLEAIYVIICRKTAARPKDVADQLQVTKASVTGALKALAERGLVYHEPYDIVTLTEEGTRLAREVDTKHKALKAFFTEVLGVAEAEAESVACKVEHAIPCDIKNRLVGLADYLEKKLNIHWDAKQGCFK